MNISKKSGFTLIEILIVVAIIAILASVVLVGLGPTQSLGRDARRVSDIHNVQNGLELYYNKNGSYPVPVTTTAGWTSLQTSLTGAGIGVSSVPDDPSSGGTTHYWYGTDSAETEYLVGATLENNSGGSWNGYSIPASLKDISNYTGGTKYTCDGNTATGKPYEYCVSL